MDFFQVSTRENRGGTLDVFPDFVVGRSKDLMVRGRSFYAIWDDEAGLWSRDEYDVQRLVDYELQEAAKKLDGPASVKYMRSFGSNGWNQFRKFMSQISDNSHQLDENLTFANSDVKKTDYVSRRLPYRLAEGDYSAWDELIGTLYSPEERAKIEWAIGAVISGDSKKIQKFLVLYGPAGTGKSTVLNIIQKLFDGYTTTFEAKALGSNSNAFATEVFKSNPLVAIQHDGDLSQIADNSKLNSLIAHEEMTFNEKYKPSYTSKANALLLMGTNQPVKISDAKSGIIRRLIDVHPTGVKLPPNHYHTLMAKIDFELGAIAHRCLEIYRKMGKNYYNAYRPLEMMFQTDIFFNFIEAHYDVFKAQDGCTLKQAYTLYKQFCDDTGIERPLPQYKVREELRNYFDTFLDRTTVEGETVRSYYSGFSADAFKSPVDEKAKIFSLVMEESTSLFDLEYADSAAQYAKDDETPQRRWLEVKTTLAEIDTSQLHYVKLPENHIVIDFDLRDETGDKSLERNLAEASNWPATYAELSKSGAGVHLHYIYTGEDVHELDSNYSDGIEVKHFSGGSSLRRRFTRCNNVPIAELNSGLPIKEKKVLQSATIQSQRGLRELIARNLRKEIHPGTKPSIDFIHRILEDAYLSGMEYDVSDLRSRIMAFANNSSNQPLQCLKTVQRMRFCSEEIPSGFLSETKTEDTRLVFFDIEVYPNLFVVCWKYQGDPTVVRMINPKAQEIEGLFKLKLVGFNNRRYDNHILWAAYMGYDNEGLYKLSKKIIDGSVGAMFGEAYRISYTDIYDFSSKKQGLKKFEIELGIHHMELDIPWDHPVPPEKIPKVVEYCVNDVVATEVVFEARKQDFVARQILAELSGLTVNDTTQKHTAKIIFGDDKNPQRSFVYTDLAKEFPGYKFDKGKSYYRGEEVGEGGYVYAEPGIYENVALLDVASMHPTSAIVLNVFGEYTANFKGLVEARLAIKAEDYDRAKNLLDGKLVPYLSDVSSAKALADALKIIVNIVYGLTSAKFDNPFRDLRNVDNIVAKRGALFMIELKHFVQERGFTVAHIKTDSIKIPGATQEIIDEVMRFGEKYGYAFEYNPKKDLYNKFCLVNDAVYIARHNLNDFDGDTPLWTAVGAQFQHPYVFKKLFSKEPITFNDLCETKEVKQGSMYLDFDHNRPMALAEEMHFVGRTGRFVPVREGHNGGILYRVKDGKNYAVTGTKGYVWIEAEMAQGLGKEAVDMQYFERLIDEAIKTIDYFGPFSTFAE
jgi:hypothetical protein